MTFPTHHVPHEALSRDGTRRHLSVGVGGVVVGGEEDVVDSDAGKEEREEEGSERDRDATRRLC